MKNVDNSSNVTIYFPILQFHILLCIVHRYNNYNVNLPLRIVKGIIWTVYAA